MTLNLSASVTTQRDKKALDRLEEFTNLPKDWVEMYFEEQEKIADENTTKTILNDTKGKEKDLVIGQLELWNSKKFIRKHLKEIEKALKSFNNPRWFLTSPSISEGKNYIYTKNDNLKRLLAKTIGVKFKGNLGTTKKLRLRKEILKKQLC